MPSPFSINNFSSAIRDVLLNKNIVSDTVIDNQLLADLNGIGLPVETETTPVVVQPSNNILITGPFQQQLNTTNNQYQGAPSDYSLVNIVNINSNITNQQGPYTNNNDLLNDDFIGLNQIQTDSKTIREDITLTNLYVDTAKQEVFDLGGSVSIPTYQNLTSYLDENNNLNVGGPSTQAADLLGGLFNGQGVGFNVEFPKLNDLNGKPKIGVLPNEDIRATLLGRVLGATGVINDSQIGIIGGQQLLAHIGYNSAFSLQQETLGQFNLNPLTLIQGDAFLVQNFQITTPSGGFGKVLNFTANILGVQSPISLLSTSIFTFTDKLEYQAMGNIERANFMLANSGNGQVKQLIAHMRANIKIPDVGAKTLRQGYSPKYQDGRRDSGNRAIGDNEFNIYARGNGDGTITDFLNGAENIPVPSGNYNRSQQISDDGWNIDYHDTVAYGSPKGTSYRDAQYWRDNNVNKDRNTISGGDQNTNFDGENGKGKKTLLSKTEQLFNSNKMQTLIIGHGSNLNVKSQINSSVSRVGGYTSKGSGVMSANAINDNTDNGPENVFCRTWTTLDRYTQVLDLQKHSGIYDQYGELGGKTIYRGNINESVLDSSSNGFVKVAPYKNNNIKKYMFSIENLAWNDNINNLLDCEVGPGDPISGLRGRIMWFPPYDLSVSESTSASWDKHNFIGRGEPMYTYNNTERTGTLNWKIIIDHPNYLNLIKNKDDDYLASFFAGCMPLENIPLTPSESEKAKVVQAKPKKEKSVIPNKPPDNFRVFFPNDVYELEGPYETYEDGRYLETINLSGIDKTFTVNYEAQSNDTSNLLGSKYSFQKQKVKQYFNLNTFINSTNPCDNYFGVVTLFDINNDSNFYKEIKSSGCTIIYVSYISEDDGLLFGSNVYLGSNNDINRVEVICYDFKKPIPEVKWETNLSGKTVIEDIDFNKKLILTSTGEPGKAYSKLMILDFDGKEIMKSVSLAGTNVEIITAKFNSDATKIIVETEDGFIFLWDVSSNKLLKAYDYSNYDFINSTYFLDNNRFIITGYNSSNKKTMDIYDANNFTKLKTISNDDNITFVGKTDKYFVTSSYKNGISIYDINTYDLIITKNIEAAEVGIYQNDDNNIYYTNIDGNKLTVINAYDFKEIYTLDIPEGYEAASLISFTSDANKIIVQASPKTYPGKFKAFSFNLENNPESSAYKDIDYKIYKSGQTYGLDTYREMCYKYTENGKETWSSSKCTSNSGSEGRLEPDRTDFGLNGKGDGTREIYGPKIDGKSYYGIHDEEYKKELNDYFRNKCPKCVIKVSGYASTAGTSARNKELSKLRAEWVAKYITENILDEEFKDRVKPIGFGEAGEIPGVKCPPADPKRTNEDGDYLLSKNDEFGCKRERVVLVQFDIDESINTDEKTTEVTTPTRTLNIPISRFISECDYFEQLKETDKVVYDNIRQKIKYFQPAFHSTTPEGFNSRLTFLQQCMRQGQTKGVVDNSNPNNLAFGRPPVCILRIGDFYHTKIIIDNISFDFEPLVWDLNPEGVGVQPMICNVTMSFSFIGGSSLNGPISKLQNAVSFNYFANTEVYDVRSDIIAFDGNEYSVIDGAKNINPNANQNRLGIASTQSGPTFDDVQPEEIVNEPILQTKDYKLTNFESIIVEDLSKSAGTQNLYAIKLVMNSENINADEFISGTTELQQFIDTGIIVRIESQDIEAFNLNGEVVKTNINYCYEETITILDGFTGDPPVLNINDNKKSLYALTVKDCDDGKTSCVNYYVGSLLYQSIDSHTDDIIGLNLKPWKYLISVTQGGNLVASADMWAISDGNYYYPPGNPPSQVVNTQTNQSGGNQTPNQGGGNQTPSQGGGNVQTQDELSGDSKIFNDACVNKPSLDIKFQFPNSLLKGKLNLKDSDKLSKTYKASVELRKGSTWSKIADFEIGNIPNSGEFISPNGGWQAVIKSQKDKKTDIFYLRVVIEGVDNYYEYEKIYVSFDCKYQNLKEGDIIKDITLWETALAEPCVKCGVNC